MDLIGRRLRFHLGPGLVLGVERLIDPSGQRYAIPSDSSLLFNVYDVMGMQTERAIGVPILNAYGLSLDQIVCFPDHFRLPGENKETVFR